MTTATLRLPEAVRKQIFEHLYEEVHSNPKVDHKNGIIRDVKILGRVSKNEGRVYSDKAMRQCAEKYENMAVNYDHNRANPNAERKIAERAGVLRNIVVKSDGV